MKFIKPFLRINLVKYLPEEVKYLTKLQQISLTKNPIKKIPTELSNIKNLEILI